MYKKIFLTQIKVHDEVYLYGYVCARVVCVQHQFQQYLRYIEMWMDKFIRKWKRSNRWKPPTCQVLLYNVVSSTHKRGESNSQLYFQNGLYLVRQHLFIRTLAHTYPYKYTSSWTFICVQNIFLSYP
jgi:hypothetical protein